MLLSFTRGHDMSTASRRYGELHMADTASPSRVGPYRATGRLGPTALLVSILLCLCSGCSCVDRGIVAAMDLTDSDTRFVEGHLRLMPTDRDRLTAAYVYAETAYVRRTIPPNAWNGEECVQPNRIPTFDANGKRVELLLRGVRPVGDARIDRDATRSLNGICSSSQDLHLLKTSVIDSGDGYVKGIVYGAFRDRRTTIGPDGKQTDASKLMGYSMVQGKLLMWGLCLLDESDPGCPEFERLRLAQEYGKRKRAGYWKDRQRSD